MESKIEYRATFSISENAELNGVSEAAVRRYILVNGIDRKYDEQLRRYTLVKSIIKKKGKDMTVQQMARQVGMSVNTFKKYAAMAEPPKKAPNAKTSVLDRSKTSAAIMSVSDDQTKILSAILRLYLGGARSFDCDLTYSVGDFYRHGVEPPRYKYDILPLADDVRQLQHIGDRESASYMPDESFSSIVIDLPVSVDDFPSSPYADFKSLDEMYDTYVSMISLADRLLKPDGVLVFKTADFVYRDRQQWISDHVIQTCYSHGLTLLDKFIYVCKTRFIRYGASQKFSRKTHAYFFVFKKSSC